MTKSAPRKALLSIDFIKSIIHPDGKVAQQGNATFALENKTLAKVKELQDFARAQNWLLVHVRIGFDDQGNPYPESSPLFNAAKKNRFFCRNSWGTEFVHHVAPQPDELVLEKKRVSAFYGTDLANILTKHHVVELIICGCATDLAVQSAARDAHDRDFVVQIVGDCCAAKDKEVHEHFLVMLKRIAAVACLKDIIN
jgi:ureidoacrylate peracid hydrolase